jgi:hypothetical protein
MSLHASTSGSWRSVAVVTCILASAAVAVTMTTGAAGGPGNRVLPADAHDGAHADARTDEALLVVEGPSNTSAHYRFAVDGALEPADEPNAAVEPGELNDTRAGGTVDGSDADAYRVSGPITELAVAGNVTLFLDGREVAPANLSDDWAVTFANCSTVAVAGDFAEGYAFSTVVFPVRGPDGDLAGYEENPVNERFDVTGHTASLRVGTTLPQDVSEISVLRSVFLYEQRADVEVDPLLVESEVAAQLGEPPVRVENPAHGACRGEIRDRLADETANGTADEASVADAAPYDGP